MKHVIFLLTATLLFTGIVLWYVNGWNEPAARTSSAQFASGIYYREPNLRDPSAFLRSIENPLAAKIMMAPVDFDLREDIVVYPNDDALVLVTADGRKRIVGVLGLYQMARPSLSSDGTMVAVQANERPDSERNPVRAEELEIYVVSLSNGSFINISNDPLPSESPLWFNQSNRIAYGTFSVEEGVDIHIYDLEKKREVLVIQDTGWLHLAVSKDDTILLVPKTMKMYDTVLGLEIGELLYEVLAGLSTSGYQLDTVYPGDFGTSFPLDGDFSPDGQEIVFDGGVSRNGISGAVIGKIRVDGTEFSLLSDFIPVNPEFGGNNNFSQLNPVWLAMPEIFTPSLP
jgi:hypothetical protein